MVFSDSENFYRGYYFVNMRRRSPSEKELEEFLEKRFPNASWQELLLDQSELCNVVWKIMRAKPRREKIKSVFPQQPTVTHRENHESNADLPLTQFGLCDTTASALERQRDPPPKFVAVPKRLFS